MPFLFLFQNLDRNRGASKRKIPTNTNPIPIEVHPKDVKNLSEAQRRRMQKSMVRRIFLRAKKILIFFVSVASQPLSWSIRLYVSAKKRKKQRIPILIFVNFQGPVNGGFQTVVQVWSGKQIPAPHSNLNFTSISPLLYLKFTLTSS